MVDAVAEASGFAVNLYSHSHGGCCAFGAATLTPNIRKLNARIVVIAGQEHVAAALAPKQFAERLMSFLHEGQ